MLRPCTELDELAPPDFECTRPRLRRHPGWDDPSPPPRFEVAYQGVVARFPRADTAAGLARLLRAAGVPYALTLRGLDGRAFQRGSTERS